MLGAIGAVTGVIVAGIVAAIVNHAGLKWMPPGQASPIPLTLSSARLPALIVGVSVGLMAMSTLAAFIPASRAARLPIVDALRHV